MRSDKQGSTPNQAQQTPSSSRPDPYKLPAILAGALIAFTPVLAIGVVVIGNQYANQSAVQLSSVSQTSGVPVQLISGETLYENTCKICHGDDGQGIPRLGKPLRNSAYVQENSDEAIFDMIAVGRLPEDPLNTTGTLMPPRGAQNISDEAIHKVIGFLREMQDTSMPTASIDAWIVEKTDASDVVVDASVLNHPSRDIFVASCSACHGANGEGIEGLGKSFVTSEFIASSTDKEIMTLIKMGRPIWDAANTTGIDMPPKGGNPAISDDELNGIIGYIRSVSTVTD